MNRHERRAAAKKGNEPAPGAADPANYPVAAPQQAGFALRLFARMLLADWVLKRVRHPDVLRILLQVAYQVDNANAIARLTALLQSPAR